MPTAATHTQPWHFSQAPPLARRRCTLGPQVRAPSQGSKSGPQARAYVQPESRAARWGVKVAAAGSLAIGRWRRDQAPLGCGTPPTGRSARTSPGAQCGPSALMADRTANSRAAVRTPPMIIILIFLVLSGFLVLTGACWALAGNGVVAPRYGVNGRPKKAVSQCRDEV